jgi:hypothetical protein
MTETEIVAVADAFVMSKLMRLLPCEGVRESPNDRSEWVVYYATKLPDSQPGEVIDGPTLVIVNTETRSARSFMGMTV